MNHFTQFNKKFTCVWPRKALTLLALCFGLLLCLPAYSQNLGRISGIVTDTSGGAVVGAATVVTDVERGITRNLTTDDSGTYSAPNLIPGTYTVRATFAGFRAVERRDILVAVGGDVHVDLTLQPGEQAQTVTVTGEAPQVTTTNAQLGGTIVGRDLADLPVAGHNFQQLMAFRPGFIPQKSSGPNQYSNGLRGEYNVYMFDGVQDMMAYRASVPMNLPWLGGPEQAVSPPADSIQEYNAVEVPKAEYGWRPGAQISLGVKSGTNTIHGSAYALGRSTATTARNPFFNDNPPVAYENFGATVGGPIKPDKLFYFVSYEGNRFSAGSPRIITVPTFAPLGGNALNSLPDALNDMISKGHANLINQLSLNLAGCVIGPAVQCDPNKSLFINNSSTSTNLPTDFTVDGTNNNGVAKFDYHLNDHHSLNGELFMGKGDALLPKRPPNITTQPYFRDPGTQNTYVARGVWTWIPNSTWVNDFRFGWDHSLSWTHTDAAGCPGTGAPDLQTTFGYVNGTPLCGMAAVTISGFNTPILGNSAGQLDWSQIYRTLDSVSKTHGNHITKFGGEYVHIAATENQSSGAARGALTFGTTNLAFPAATPLENFFAAFATTGSSITVGNIERHAKVQQFAFYVQDDWRIVPRLTLNLGLRYEYQTPMHERDDLFGNFDPTAKSGLVQEGADQSLYRFSPWFISPRFGLAWDVNGKGTTVVRTSFNIIQNNVTMSPFFSPAASLYSNPTGLPLTNGSTTVTTPGGTIAVGTFAITPPAAAFWAANVPVFASYASATLPACSNLKPCALGATVPRLIVPMIFEWNFGIQRVITKSLALTVSYVGNHGQHELGYTDVNQPLPGTSGAANEQLRRPYTLNGQFPWFGEIRMLGGTYNYSNYTALQASLVQRVNRGLSFVVGYTYSHALDEGSQEIGLTRPQDSRNPGAEYGNAISDIPQVLTLTGTYVIPGKKSFGQILDGWKLTSTLVAWAGAPYNPTDSADDLSGTAQGQDRWTLVGVGSDFKSLGTLPIPCYGAAGSAFASAGCTVGLPSACSSAAATEQLGPQGQTGAASLTKLGCYMESNSVIVPPAQGTFGTMSRYMLFSRPYRYWNLSIVKNWKLKERLSTEFRTEVFNVTNSTKLGDPTATLNTPATFGAAQQTPDVGIGSPIIGVGGPRRVQFGLKFLF
jgi:hypothetical protein